MSKHTPNDCICKSTDVITTTNSVKGFRTYCVWCGRSGAWQKTISEAVADWNRQTAAPDLLKVALNVVKYQRLLTEGNSGGDSDEFTIADLLETATRAIAKAEPKP